jgi:hypothetical protein
MNGKTVWNNASAQKANISKTTHVKLTFLATKIILSGTRTWRTLCIAAIVLLCRENKLFLQFVSWIHVNEYGSASARFILHSSRLYKYQTAQVGVGSLADLYEHLWDLPAKGT